MNFLKLLFIFYICKAQVYDAEFWDGFDSVDGYYEHNWLDVPDLINKTEVRFWFHMTN